MVTKAALKAAIEEAWRANRRYAQIRRRVDRFAKTHPRLDELGRVIEREIAAGYSLAQAYRRAVRRHPQEKAS